MYIQSPGRVPLLELDHELGSDLEPTRRRRARASLTVRTFAVRPGPWLGSFGVREAGSLGYLIFDGLVARDVLVGKRRSTELLGPGDLVQPWTLADLPPGLATDTQRRSLGPCHLAFLDQRVVVNAAPWPEILARLVGRAGARTHRLAQQRAILQSPRLDERLVAMLTHLAGRFGRPTTDGLLLTLRLSHEELARLVAARRPSVSRSLAALAADGVVRRDESGGYLITGGEAVLARMGYRAGSATVDRPADCPGRPPAPSLADFGAALAPGRGEGPRPTHA